MGLVFHIAEPEAWNGALGGKEYEPAGFPADGFIHCARREQLAKVAASLFAGRNDLFLLTIDEDLVESEIRYESIDTPDVFPHIYGSLNLDAVTNVMRWSVGSDGSCELPTEAEA